LRQRKADECAQGDGDDGENRGAEVLDSNLVLGVDEAREADQAKSTGASISGTSWRPVPAARG
jgi:hypothetical protein